MCLQRKQTQARVRDKRYGLKKDYRKNSNLIISNSLQSDCLRFIHLQK